MITLILTISISMAVSALCSILEATLLSLSGTDIAEITEKKPKIAQIWNNFKNNLHRPIAVILIVNTFAHTIGASLSGAQFNQLFGPKYLTLFSIIYSLIMIQWTEILPKTFGVRFNRIIAIQLGKPFHLLTLIMNPLVYITKIFNKPFEFKDNKKTSIDELNDIKLLVRFASLNKKISKDHAEMLSHAVMLSKSRIQDIMVSQDEIRYLSAEMSLGEALIEAHIHHHTRLPLIEGKDINNIIGYVNYKDIVSALQFNPTNPTLRGICRPIISVNENDSLTNLLNNLIKTYQHIAVVKNLNNQVTGVVTLEDVIEEIVGDINDEYDLLPSHIYQININRYICGGGLPLHELSKNLSVEIISSAKTIQDYIFILNNGILPKVGEKIIFENLTFMIKKVRRSNLFEIIVEISK